MRFGHRNASTLRAYIRSVLMEMGGPAAASGTDPKDAKGFYPYDIERGADIHSFWYRSPGRGMGSDGDFRPDDPMSYIGMSAPASAEADATPASTTTEEPSA
jgi:hypothetical protein